MVVPVRVTVARAETAAEAGADASEPELAVAVLRCSWLVAESE
jgi:hypothetical protein